MKSADRPRRTLLRTSARARKARRRHVLAERVRQALKAMRAGRPAYLTLGGVRWRVVALESEPLTHRTHCLLDWHGRFVLAQLGEKHDWWTVFAEGPVAGLAGHPRVPYSIVDRRRYLAQLEPAGET